MLRLGILGLGMVAAMLVIDCGARTPLADDELFGEGPTTTGGSGTISIGQGAGGTVAVGGAGSVSTGVGGSGFPGNAGFGGTGVGVGGSVIVGSGGSVGIGGSGVAGSSGIGGSVGAAGSSTGTAGSVGAGGTGAGPNPVRNLIDELPGTRSTPACIACASMCQGSSQCAANTACVAGLACAANTPNCGMGGRRPNLQCLANCVGGNPQTLAQAVTAIACVYATCADSCTGRMR
jgi:hypothetical protein